MITITDSQRAHSPICPAAFHELLRDFLMYSHTHLCNHTHMRAHPCTPVCTHHPYERRCMQNHKALCKDLGAHTHVHAHTYAHAHVWKPIALHTHVNEYMSIDPALQSCAHTHFCNLILLSSHVHGHPCAPSNPLCTPTCSHNLAHPHLLS